MAWRSVEPASMNSWKRPWGSSTTCRNWSALKPMSSATLGSTWVGFSVARGTSWPSTSSQRWAA